MNTKRSKIETLWNIAAHIAEHAEATWEEYMEGRPTPGMEEMAELAEEAETLFQLGESVRQEDLKDVLNWINKENGRTLDLCGSALDSWMGQCLDQGTWEETERFLNTYDDEE